MKTKHKIIIIAIVVFILILSLIFHNFLSFYKASDEVRKTYCEDKYENEKSCPGVKCVTENMMISNCDNYLTDPCGDDAYKIICVPNKVFKKDNL